jgi:hypothetical protein
MDDVSRGDQAEVIRFGRPLVILVSPDWHKAAEPLVAHLSVIRDALAMASGGASSPASAQKFREALEAIGKGEK